MDLRLTAEQEAIRTLAREFFMRECTLPAVKSLLARPKVFSESFWKRFAAAGWLGLGLPREFGGQHCGLTELALVMEEQGRAGWPSPFCHTAALCSQAILRFGNDAQRSQFLRAMADGAVIMVYAETESGGGWGAEDIRLVAAAEPATMAAISGGYLLNGVKFLVPFAGVATHFLAVARTGCQVAEGTRAADGLTLFIVDAGSPVLTVKRLDTVGLEPMYMVTFANVPVSSEHVLGGVGDGEPIRRIINEWGAATKCAEMVGGAERVLAMATNYAKTRRQFDRPIGSFQAVQHHCANMAVDAVSSRYIAYEAIWRLAAGMEAAEQVHMAKAWVSEAYSRICALGHQIHGALGFTKEHDLHLFTRHAKAAGLAFGDALWHRRLLAKRLGLT